MPTLTIHVSDEHLTQLTELGDELSQSPGRAAERLLYITLLKQTKRPSVTNKQRAADRALRQLALMRLLRRRRISTLGQTEKKKLARQFGVTERTIYRDLDVLDAARRLDARGTEPPDEDADQAETA